MPIPSGVSLFVVAANPGLDGNRISVNIFFVFGAGGTSVSVSTHAYNRVVINVTEGFDFTSGTNDPWDTIAAAINSAASAYVTAYGNPSDNSIVTPASNGLAAGDQSANAGQYYSGGVAPNLSKRFPVFIKGRGAGQGVY